MDWATCHLSHSQRGCRRRHMQLGFLMREIHKSVHGFVSERDGRTWAQCIVGHRRGGREGEGGGGRHAGPSRRTVHLYEQLGLDASTRFVLR